MAESVGVVIIILIMIIIGIAIYSSYNRNKYNEEIQQASEINTLKLANIVSSLPEIHCTNNKISCIDILKVIAFINLMESSDSRFFYSSFFGNAYISIIQVLPNSSTFFENEEIVLYENIPEEYVLKNPVFIPINLYNPITNTRGFAILKVERYA
ncbi:MAG: hypothetical protein QXG00_00315 [Candidatus Woesearchaeota archaeon]